MILTVYIYAINRARTTHQGTRLTYCYGILYISQASQYTSQYTPIPVIKHDHNVYIVVVFNHRNGRFQLNTLKAGR